MSRLYVPSEKIGTILNYGKLRCKAADNSFKLVQITYLAVISYLDKLVQPSYTLSARISPLALPRASLATLATLTPDR